MGKKPESVRLLARRKQSIRKKISGDTERPRLTVRRSLKHIYAQIIDDSTGKTVASASSVALKIPGTGVEAAKKVGAELAQRAKSKSVEQVRFDRAGRLFHGRVKALADAVREGGVKF